MAESSIILSFESVSTAIDDWYDSSIENLSLQLNPGEMALVRFDRHTPHSALPDAAMGLVDLRAGEVKFQQVSWAALSPGEASQARGQIGRFFGERGWVNHLDVDENITLRQRHHTKRPLVEIETEADQIAKAMGLANGLPRVRPTNVDAQDLQRAACVRMLLGAPALLVLDEPTSGLYSDVLEALGTLVEQARARGAAVLWMSADPFVWADTSFRPTVRVNLTEKHSAHSSVPANGE